MGTGFFAGYSWKTVLIIVMQTVVGLSTGMILKFADNIVRVFSIAGATVFTMVLSVFVFGFHPSLAFVAGLCTVVLSMWLYYVKPNVIR
jgi:solute carrier family 35 (UDP-sugar transporter), member A1/2/3